MELPSIKIDNFEGPFDLLLHLIKKNQMNIYNVEIYKVTNQYLSYLDKMKEMDLDITSEFIVVAATLIEIKSKTLLPKPKKEEEDEEDIEKNLLEKLILYKKIKESTNFFRERYTSSGSIFTKKPEIIEEVREPIDNQDLLKNITLLDLYNIYNNLIEIHRNKQNRANVIQKKIYVDKYKIEDKFSYLSERLEKGKATDFEDIMMECECKIECVVTFLALLEMIKQKVVKVYQSSSFGTIIIERMAEEDE
ncbi:MULTISPECIES: segregation/condensation protein A [Clostridium]|uniref:Segregation and condensation protein A n=1 Tax=Clostridium cibarium TaxID=2762247 RepID=A0ABR8PP89_9CLOT|nr:MULTISPECIES: segregation/condensation protein A [Clostridium]MBD7909993.1 segregation/condensation protein A [Clostridium cibarium]